MSAKIIFAPTCKGDKCASRTGTLPAQKHSRGWTSRAPRSQRDLARDTRRTRSRRRACNGPCRSSPSSSCSVSLKDLNLRFDLLEHRADEQAGSVLAALAEEHTFESRLRQSCAPRALCRLVLPHVQRHGPRFVWRAPSTTSLTRRIRRSSTLSLSPRSRARKLSIAAGTRSQCRLLMPRCSCCLCPSSIVAPCALLLAPCSWKSKVFPVCDASHVKHNEECGDNVGPLIIEKD